MKCNNDRYMLLHYIVYLQQERRRGKSSGTASKGRVRDKFDWEWSRNCVGDC